MTTLTLLELNPRSQAARRSLKNPQAVHKTLMACLPQHYGNDARSAFGVLWRVEPGDAPTILMQTADEPDLAKLPHAYADAQTRRIDDHITSLHDGQIVHYRVVLNPIRKSRTGGKSRQFVIPPRERADWASERLASNGLVADSLPAVTGLPARYISRSGERFPIYSIRADGIGHVSDPESLKRAIKNGIGPAKAWGCGLITVLRVDA